MAPDVRRDRRSRERRRRDRDRKRREEKKANDATSKKNQIADDTILDKYEPQVCMEDHNWPMPLPEDAGRVRAYGTVGQTHEFWEYYEDYFKPLKDDVLKQVLAEPDLEHDECFRMPALGPHYASAAGKKGGTWEQQQQQQQQWEQEMFTGMDMDDEEGFLSKTVMTSSGRVVGGKRKTAEPPSAPPGGWGAAPPTDASGGDTALVSAKMVMRLMACFIQQDGVPSKHEEDSKEDLASLPEGQQSLLSFPIEQRMRQELSNLGLMEAPEAEYDQPHLREDDQICAELRYQQQALKKHVVEREAAQTASRRALQTRIMEGLPKERVLAEVYQSAKNLESLLQPKFKLTKGVKPQDIRKAIDHWDRALMRYKAFMANANRRKPSVAQLQQQQAAVPGASAARPVPGGMQPGAARHMMGAPQPGMPPPQVGQPGMQRGVLTAQQRPMGGSAPPANRMAQQVAQFHSSLQRK